MAERGTSARIGDSGPTYRFGGVNVSIEGAVDPYFLLADRQAEADIVVRHAPIVDTGQWEPAGHITIDGDEVAVDRWPDGYRVSWPGWFDAMLLDDGRRVVVDQEGRWPGLTRALLTTVVPVMLGYWGRVTVHASAVELDGVAVVMAGESGSGKSTLATALCLQGGRLLADDVAVLRLADDGRVVVDATSRATRLFADTATALGARGFPSPGEVKELVAGPTPPNTVDGVPVAAFLCLAPGDGEVSPLRGADAAVQVLRLMPAAVDDARSEWQALRLDVATAVTSQARVRRVAWAPGADEAMRLARAMPREWRAEAVSRALGGADC